MWYIFYSFSPTTLKYFQPSVLSWYKVQVLNFVVNFLFNNSQFLRSWQGWTPRPHGHEMGAAFLLARAGKGHNSHGLLQKQTQALHR